MKLFKDPPKKNLGQHFLVDQEIIDKMQKLFKNGHPDVEGTIGPSTCAVLGRNRFVLLAIERELRARQIPYYKRLTANHENESDTVEDFVLALRVLAKRRSLAMRSRLAWSSTARRWSRSRPSLRPRARRRLRTPAPGPPLPRRARWPLVGHATRV